MRDHDQDWEAPIVELSRDACAWLVWLMSRDLEQWHPGRQTRLSRDEATALATFLADHLPRELRTEVPALRPALKAG